MTETFDSVYPDFLRTGLEKLNQLGAQRELPALFAAMEHFRRDLHEQDTAKGVLRVSQGYLGGLNLFCKTGFWTVNTQDFNFELSFAGNEADGVILQSIVDGQITAGRFAYALRQGTPVFFLLGNHSDPERGVLHSLAISSQVVGMFCGLLRREVAPAQEVAFSLLSMLLGGSADALATLRRTRQLTGQIEALEKLLPVCAWCKKVRNDSGYWYQIEKYITANSRTKITHGICPDCEAKLLRDGE
ncbi:MAG: hypothetical protein ABSH48_05805 [Verrucomicrobiota bacterium]|jgi:hypothetical protein